MSVTRFTAVAALAALALAPALRADEVAVAGEDGFAIQTPNGDYKLRFAGYAQGDGRFYFGDDEARVLAVDSFLLRRVRPILLGTLAKRFDLYFVPDFGEGKAVIQDAYLDARFTPQIRLRVGKYKTPFGLERLQSGAGLLFVERALPTSIVPNRDIGVQLHGELVGGVVAYAAAVLNGVADGGSADADTNDGKDLAGRLFLQPFKKQKQGALKGLGFGVAATWGKQDGLLALPVYRTPAQVPFFAYSAGVAADGRRWRLSPQAQLYTGPVGVLGEYARSTQKLRKGGSSEDLTNDAWQVAVSWLLTGEKAGGAVKPKRPIGVGEGGRGAIELVARVHGLGVDEAAFASGFADGTKAARKASAWGVGVNWYLNRNVKYVVNYEQTSFEGGAQGGDRRAEKALLMRAQVAF